MHPLFALFSFFISIFFSFYSFSMNPTEYKDQEMIHFCLMDEKRCHNLPLWKVKESETLFNAYCIDREQFPSQKCKISLCKFSRKEFELFDKALDADVDPASTSSFSVFFTKLPNEDRHILTVAAGEYNHNREKKLHARRVSAQLLDEWIGYKKDFEYARIKLRFGELMHYYKLAVIKENLDNHQIIISIPYEYVSSELVQARSKIVAIKKLPHGGYVFVPCIENLNQMNFNAQARRDCIPYQDMKYVQYAQANKKNDFTYIITSSALLPDKKILDNQINIFKYLHQNKCIKHIKKIEHESIIDQIYLSPDGNWLITASKPQLGRTNAFTLTCLDESDECYSLFSDISLAAPSAFICSCFNSASTILACVKANCKIQGDRCDRINSPVLQLFDIKTKILRKDKKLKTPNKDLFAIGAVLSFNHDNSRLVCFLQTETNSIVFIWDTSDIDNIKQLKCTINKTSPTSQYIDFSYPKQDTIIVSTDTTSMFFDAMTGEFLSRTAPSNTNESEDSTDVSTEKFVAISSMPFHPVTLVGKNYATHSSVSLYHHNTGEKMGTITYRRNDLCGIGITDDARRLIATFKNHEAIQSTTYEKEEIKTRIEKMRFIDIYILQQLYNAKKIALPVSLHSTLVDYIKNVYPSDENDKKIIPKYFFNS